MRLLLTILLALVCCTGRAAFIPNSFTTNALGTNVMVVPGLTGIRIDGANPGFVLRNTAGGADEKYFYLQNTGNRFYIIGATDDGLSTWSLGNWDTNGNFRLNGFASLSGTTNQLTVAAGVLKLDGVAIGSSTSTNYYSTIITTNLTVLNSLYASNFFVTNVTVQNNLTVSNLFTVNGNHNTLIVTNALTLNSLKTNLLAVTSTGLITNANYGSGLTWTPSTLTLSASSGTTVSVNATNVTTPNLQDTATVTWGVSGSNVTATAVSSGGSSSPWSPVTALTYSTTNVTIPVPTSTLTNFLITLTNSTTYFVAPTTLPASTSTNTTFYLFLQQDATGVRAVSWAGNFKWPGGVAPVITTNASAIDCIVFTTSPLTATNLFGTWQPNFQ